jgi:hypothetical protein
MLLFFVEFVLDGQQVEKFTARTVLKHKVQLLLVLECPVELD